MSDQSSCVKMRTDEVILHTGFTNTERLLVHQHQIIIKIRTVKQLQETAFIWKKKTKTKRFVHKR